MSKSLRLLSLLFFGMLVALAIGLTSAKPASAQACDTTGTIDGSADPTTVLPGQTVTFTTWNFRPGENASFWFTLPNGVVFGTASPLCCAASDGYVRFQPTTIPDEFYNFPGRWALTVQGASSQHTSVVYFCLATTAQPTNTVAPPTATTAPPSPTTQPTVAASPTVPATTEPTTPPTAAVSPTTEPTAQPTAQPTSAVVPSLTVRDQVLNNNTVIVDMVVAAQDGWAVVHESNPDGTVMAPASIGRTYVRAGETANVSIVLEKQVANGAKLWPMLHVDAGAIGTYEFPGPDAPVVVNGEVVMVPIVVTTQTIGMPRTGEPDGGSTLLLVTVALVGMGLLAAGLLARRAKPIK